jgi:hypothetical protein
MSEVWPGWIKRVERQCGYGRAIYKIEPSYGEAESSLVAAIP